MEEPAKTDPAVGVEPPVGAGGHDRGEREFPEAQPAIEIGRTRPREHDRHEVLAVGFSERGGGYNKEQGDDDGRHDLHQRERGESMHGHG